MTINHRCIFNSFKRHKNKIWVNNSIRVWIIYEQTSIRTRFCTCLLITSLLNTLNILPGATVRAVIKAFLLSKLVPLKTNHGPYWLLTTDHPSLNEPLWIMLKNTPYCPGDTYTGVHRKWLYRMPSSGELIRFSWFESWIVSNARHFPVIYSFSSFLYSV